MSLSPSAVVRCCARISRQSAAVSLLRTAVSISPHSRRSPAIRRWNSTETASAHSANPKISNIVDQISQLTLLETADLVSSLKSRLNIPDMPMGGFMAAPPVAAAPAAAEEETAPPEAQEKTLFNLKLESFEPGSKPKVIKEVKALLGLSLVESKKFVESAPKIMKEGVPKEEAEKIVETLKGLGGKVVME